MITDACMSNTYNHIHYVCCPNDVKKIYHVHALWPAVIIYDCSIGLGNIQGNNSRHQERESVCVWGGGGGGRTQPEWEIVLRA